MHYEALIGQNGRNRGPSEGAPGGSGGLGMVTPDRVNFLFADARSLYDDAIEMLDQGKIRNAAEKAWARHEAGHRRPGPGKARGRAAIGRTGTARSFAAGAPWIRRSTSCKGNITPGQGPAHQLLLRRELRTGAGDGRPDTGHHPVHRPRREAFRRVIMARTWCGMYP